MPESLADKHCKPCEGGVAPLTGRQASEMLGELHTDWQIEEGGLSIRRAFSFPTYGRVLAFANAVAWIATREGHHPVLTLSYSSCDVSYTTHAIDGLSENDFICAAKIDQLTESD